MNNYIIDDGTTRYIRISKREAVKRWDNGKSVVFCPVKLRPGFPFAPHMELEKTIDRESFEASLNAFNFYNCNMAETGYYSAFYRTEPTQKRKEVLKNE